MQIVANINQSQKLICTVSCTKAHCIDHLDALNTSRCPRTLNVLKEQYIIKVSTMYFDLRARKELSHVELLIFT